MYFQLTGAVTDRFIKELRHFWSFDPRFKDRLPENIQGRFAFKERPQVGIIVKASGASNVVMAADNYMGTVNSYVMLARYRDYPGLSIEWVRENTLAIQQNGGVFPSAPGIYYIDMIGPDQFVVDVLLDVRDERVACTADPLVFQLQGPPLPQSLRLYELPSSWLLQPGVNYTLDVNTGTITLTEPLIAGSFLAADYRTAEPVSRGPFQVAPNRANVTAIPGAVLAFGERFAQGDRMAVIVQEVRSPAYMEYGGQWDVSIDIDFFARDIHEQRMISDTSLIYFWGVLRERLTSEGLKIEEISLGGESEEVYDENGDDYFFNNTISMTVKTDWNMQVPLSAYIRRVMPLTNTDEVRISGLGADGLSGETGNIIMLENLNLELLTDPFFQGRNATYEVIR